MRTRDRVITALLAGAGAVTLAACGSDDESTTVTDAVQGAESIATEAQSAATTAEEALTDATGELTDLTDATTPTDATDGGG